MRKVVLFIFHRDLRIVDHRPLQAALDSARDATVLPLFIFENEQVSRRAVRSENSIACLLQSLKELDAELPSGLAIMYGAVEKVLSALSEIVEIAAVYETADYTPYAINRQERTAAACDKIGCEYTAVDDLYLFSPGSILNGSGNAYQKFTPFYEAAIKMKTPTVLGKVTGPFLSKALVSKISQYTLDEVTDHILTAAQQKAVTGRRFLGGRQEGLQLLRRIPKEYDTIRNIAAENTSGLSVHHHYGTVSIRESWWAAEKLLKKDNLKGFQRQLIWRDFYAHLMAEWDTIYSKKYGELHEWLQERPKLTKKQQEQFTAWCEGKTGIPLIDAGMTEMNKTGFMHNRARMVVASVLTRDWGIPWQWGAGYFAEKLCDYDYVQNTMNWLHIAEHFPFSQAPFRRHDPYTSAKRVDPDNAYINHWLKIE